MGIFGFTLFVALIVRVYSLNRDGCLLNASGQALYLETNPLNHPGNVLIVRRYPLNRDGYPLYASSHPLIVVCL